MAKKASLILSSILLLAGCNRNSPDEYARFHNDGRAKPIVALMPVLDSTENELEWNLANEFTDSLRYKINAKGDLFLVSEKEIQAKIDTLADSDRPFDPEVNWAADRFPEQEFVVFTEIIQHEETPLDPKQSAESSAKLNMSMRVRVVDLRGKAPKVILQEIVEDTTFIPRAFTRENFAQEPWGSEMYDLSPMGVAHAQFIKEVTQRIEDYILLAKSR